MENSREKALTFQKNEITEHIIYQMLARRAKGKNREIINRISNDELRHYNEWKSYTGIDVSEDKMRILKFTLLSLIFGVTFTAKLMEKGEKVAETTYQNLERDFPKSHQILLDEEVHENLLVNLIKEERVAYVSSVVLGLNDALVEITGTLAGLTFALQNSKTIGVAGAITGIAASLSMAASSYLSEKSDTEGKPPLKASMYTFFAYLGAVIMLVLPFFLLSNFYVAFSASIFAGVFIIAIFSEYSSVVQDRTFTRIFLEMILIVAGVSAISFLAGLIARSVFHISI
ncbi:MAG: VIT1/CCC1 transporter family protein [Caldisericaceae bacterium]